MELVLLALTLLFGVSRFFVSQYVYLVCGYCLYSVIYLSIFLSAYLFKYLSTRFYLSLFLYL